MRNALLVVVLAATVVGCAHAGRNPTVPVTPGGDQGAHASRLHSELTDTAAQTVDRDGPYQLWGEWTFFINAERDRVDVVPRRDMHFHLNALRFLEEYCKDCLQITGIKNNGDSTIDLTVRITHPFKGFPQYTGFDVKGIIMFNGSHAIPTPPQFETRGWIPSPCMVSWRELGDPELLNPDGYTPRWNPAWDSGSDMPIFNYWKGRYARGVPNADLNAFLNFYSHEERLMFAHGASVSRTYHIWLPPGPVVAGYAVEACWEPPIKTPVTNPIEDFPISANQPEAYHWKWVVNNGEPIIQGCGCCNGYGDCSDIHMEYRLWKEFAYTPYYWVNGDDGSEGPWGRGGGADWFPCEIPEDVPEDWSSPGGFPAGDKNWPLGKHQELAVLGEVTNYPDSTARYPAFTLYDYEIVEPD